MLLICSGSRICNHPKCQHKRTHYALHAAKESFGRANCAVYRCFGGMFSGIEQLDGVELYFECVPWRKGIEETFVHAGMSRDEILCNTRWYMPEFEEDGWLSPFPQEDFDDNGGSDVPQHLVKSRGVSTPKLMHSDPAYPRKEGLSMYRRLSQRAPSMFGRVTASDNMRLRDLHQAVETVRTAQVAPPVLRSWTERRDSRPEPRATVNRWSRDSSEIRFTTTSTSTVQTWSDMLLSETNRSLGFGSATERGDSN